MHCGACPPPWCSQVFLYLLRLAFSSAQLSWRLAAALALLLLYVVLCSHMPALSPVASTARPNDSPAAEPPRLPCRSKAAGLASPFYFKSAVDALSMGAAGAGPRAAAAATTALLLAGACRMISGIAKEVQGPIFAPVSQVCPP